MSGLRLNDRAFALPYSFDTTTSFRTVVKGALGLEFVLIAGILYSALVSRDIVAVTGLLLFAAVIATTRSASRAHLRR